MGAHRAAAGDGRLRLNSIESFSTLDGPGVRFVVFVQGCPMRCKYCHNPETWSCDGGQPVPVEDILDKLDWCRRLVPSIGLTISGGEPLMQHESCLGLLAAAKSRGIHTALDTSGCGCEHGLVRLLRFTDVVLFDVKAVDRRLHADITGTDNDCILNNMAAVSDTGVEMWVRRVLIPGVNDSIDEARRLRALIDRHASVARVDIIPYHRMGVNKWRQLGMVCPYEGVPVPGREAIERFRGLLDSESAGLPFDVLTHTRVSLTRGVGVV